MQSDSFSTDYTGVALSSILSFIMKSGKMLKLFLGFSFATALVLILNGFGKIRLVHGG